MFGITDLGTFVLGTVVIVLLPGPNSLYVLSVAARRGVAAGYRGALGIVVGDTVLMSLSAAGMGSVLALYPQWFAALRLAGAAYLVWLGLRLMLGALRRWRQGVAEPPALPGDQDRPFRRALAISLVNPKAILFFVSFFIQFVDRSYPHPAVTFVALGVLVQLVSVLYLSTLIVAGARVAAAFRRRRRLAAGAAAAVGAVFVGFGARLAATQ